MPEHPPALLDKLDPDFMKKVGVVNGVRALAGQALAAGATPQEMTEALRVAYYLSGVGSLYVASQGLKDCLS